MSGLFGGSHSWNGRVRVLIGGLLSVPGLAASLVLAPLSAKGTDFASQCQTGMQSVVRIFQNEKNRVNFASGIVISKDGEILTCAHVVDGVGRIDVMFGDGLTNPVYSARLIKIDKNIDLALIRLVDHIDGLKRIPLSTAPAPQPGTPVATIGSPLKTFRTATAGIVSYCGQDEGQDILVFDAKVMPGCSGGPVMDESGQLVGIVTGVIGRGEYELSRAIYVSEIERFLNRPQRGFLGIGTQPVKTGIAGASCEDGLKVTKLTRSSDLKEGDVIMTFNDYQLKTHSDLVRMSRNCTPGQNVELGILRNGEFKTVRILVAELPDR